MPQPQPQPSAYIGWIRLAQPGRRHPWLPVSGAPTRHEALALLLRYADARAALLDLLVLPAGRYPDNRRSPR